MDRTCASDERCQNNACVYVGLADGGSGGTCTPGCSGSATVRRCNMGEPVDIACNPGRVCMTGDCVLVMDDGGLAGDAGCVDTCVDSTTLRACTTTGQTLVVTCQADAPCQDGQCTPPPQEDPTDDSGCPLTGISTWASLFTAGVLLRSRRRR